MKYYDDVCNKHSERMHRKSKAKFRKFLQGAIKENNFDSKIDSNMFAKNVVVGDPKKAEYILTAHYDTPPTLPKFFVKHMLLHSFLTLPLFVFTLSYLIPLGLLKIPFFLDHASLTAIIQQVLTVASMGIPTLHLLGFLGNANKHNANDNSSGVLALLNTMEKLKDAPQKIKDKFCFVFTDNEEKFLLGGFSFAHKYKKYFKNKDKTFINFDCVGLGDQVMAYHTTEKPTQIVKDLYKMNGQHFIYKPKKSGLMSMSDHIAFSNQNHVTLLCVDKNNNKSLYSQIHSSNDTKCNASNIDHLTSNCLEIITENIIQKSKQKQLFREQEATKQTTINKKAVNYPVATKQKDEKKSSEQDELSS